MRLLEEFWYGNIEPTEYDTNACKEYKEVLLAPGDRAHILSGVFNQFLSALTEPVE